jgi:hypothetical protein
MFMILKKVILLGIIVFLGYNTLIPKTVLAWDDCVRGLVNDPYPGECARYIDTDNDDICDHSQLAPEDRVEGELIEPITLPSENQDGGPVKKLLPVVGMVLFYLVGILSYVGYRKSRLK